MNSAVIPLPSVGLFQRLESDAVSEEAALVSRAFHETREELMSSYSLGCSREECQNRLIAAYQEAASEGWDGYGGRSVESAAIENAFNFIEALPSNLPMPDVSADPDGEISFDWLCGPRRQFSISLGDRNVMSYAGLFGSDKVAGSERFRGEIPQTLIQYVKRAAI